MTTQNIAQEAYLPGPSAANTVALGSGTPNDAARAKLIVCNDGSTTLCITTGAVDLRVEITPGQAARLAGALQDAAHRAIDLVSKRMPR